MLIFVRHGESEANLLREFSNRGFKHGLTEKGRLQAEDLAEKLWDKGISCIYSSPLLRAVQTAEILSQRLQVEYEVREALREFDCGVLEGKSDAESWQVYWQTMEDWLVKRLWDSRIEGGESFVDMQHRFVPLIEALSSNPETQGNAVMVGHGGLLRCMLPLVLENIDFDFTWKNHIPNTGYILARWDGKCLHCMEWCGIVFPEM